ncbi:NADPH-dependent F420 reductase [Sphingobium sp. EP60837]|uniref:NADPH-dependent F420 reductase n=1 Tax=Sphingobium sp. EP60837 TaxID=1855519 RepID=UPI0012E85D93|nr:NAD(P)-binding domain-containing protein [Sphingobium sp. EP60837]
MHGIGRWRRACSGGKRQRRVREPEIVMPRAVIIGSGNIGSAVAGRLKAIGYDVVMANSREPSSLTDHARRLGITPGTLEDAAGAADFVLIAIPQHAVAKLPPRLFARTSTETVVLDAGNYYPRLRDGTIAEIDAGMPDSQWVEQQIGRPVIKMFNTIHAGRIADAHRPPGAPDRICLPVAGDDVAAKARAVALADLIGFDGIDAGPLAQSWRQQPGMPVFCTHVPTAKATAALAQARHDAVEAKRQEALDRARRWSRDGADVGRLPAG